MTKGIFWASVASLFAFFGLAVAAKAQPQQTSCAQVFSAISFNGTQYPLETTLGFPPPIVSGTVSLNIEFRSLPENIVTPGGDISLRYTVDNQPIGPVLTNDFAWSLDTSTIADGTHSLSVLYVNESPQTPCAALLGRQYVFAVVNHKVIKGAQAVPVISPPHFGTVLPQFADFVTYPGVQGHSVPHSRPAQVIPPAGGVAPADFWGESLLAATSNAREPSPTYWQLRNGSIVEDPLFPSLIGCDDLRKPLYDFDSTGPTWEHRKAYFDGQQDDVRLASYASFVPNLDGPGFYGVSIEGRLFLLGTNGSIQTLAGWTANRSVTPYEYLDGTISLSLVQNQQTLVGKFDFPFQFPTDLAIDPTNHSHIFVADMNNHRIALVDLSQSPPNVSTFAGVSGQSGYQDGSASTALFNQPSSLAIASDRTIYVADAENGVIRKIDPTGVVSTLVGLGPAQEPTTTVVAKSPLTYAPRAAVPFATAYVNYPNTIRFDSKGNLVLAETVSETIRYIDLAARTITTIAQLANVGSAFGEQVWIDVDRNGNVGGKDDIIATMVSAQQNGLFRIPITGTTQVPPPMLTKHSTNPVYSGHTTPSSMPWTSTPWSVAIDDQEGRMVVSGVQSSGVISLRLPQPADPPFQLNLPKYTAGRNIWLTGTVPNFPFGSRPGFAAVHGYEGHSGLGNVMNFDDLVAMSDSQLGTYLQNGAEGAVTRPEITGNDLRNLIYYVRRTATGGDMVVPGADNPDTVAPTISAIAATQPGSTSLSVSWTTSEPALGFVAWGTTSGNYFGWSPLEGAYSTTHSIAVSNLPALETIYFVVWAKDLAGNQSVSSEHVITLH